MGRSLDPCAEHGVASGHCSECQSIAEDHLSPEEIDYLRELTARDLTIEAAFKLDADRQAEIRSLEEQVKILLDFADHVKANRYGLQGLLEDDASEEKIAAYYASEIAGYQREAWAVKKRIQVLRDAK